MTTYVEEEMHALFFVLMILILLVFGLLSIFWLPLTYMLSKSAVHRCSRCLQRMGEKKSYGLPNSFSDDVTQTNS